MRSWPQKLSTRPLEILYSAFIVLGVSHEKSLEHDIFTHNCVIEAAYNSIMI